MSPAPRAAARAGRLPCLVPSDRLLVTRPGRMAEAPGCLRACSFSGPPPEAPGRRGRSGAGGGGGSERGVGEVVAADHVGDAGGLVAAFDLDGDPGDQVDGVGGDLVEAGDGGAGADAPADEDGGGE